MRIDPGLLRKLYTYFIPRPANMFVRVYNTNGMEIADTTYTDVTWDGEIYDTGANDDYTNGFFDAGASTTRLTATVSGWYDIGGCIAWEANAGGTRRIALIYLTSASRAIAAPIAYDSCSPATTIVYNSVSTQHWMEPGDHVVLRAYQDSGGAIDIQRVNYAAPEFWMCRVP